MKIITVEKEEIEISVCADDLIIHLDQLSITKSK